MAMIAPRRIWREKLEGYEPPAIDPGLRQELADFVARRRTELGD